MENEEDKRKAKIQALRHLRDVNFYEPEIDNPEGLPLDEEQPSGNSEQTMQSDSKPLEDVLTHKRNKKLLDQLFPGSGNPQK